MNFNAPLLKPIRILLFPFSLVYGLLVWIRNKLFDKNVLTVTSFNLPIICVGNLSAGGTGKSVMVEFIVRHFQHKIPLSILSRGYKRKTTGFALADDKTTALEIGDEPMQFRLKFPDITIAVGEERLVAIPQILHDRPHVKLIILDDAFQHRSVKAGLNIILTEYSNLFTRDWFLPTGDLRDQKSSYKRAEVLVVTKCPAEMSTEDSLAITKEIDVLPHQHIFFSSIRYGTPYHLTNRSPRPIRNNMEVLLVSGIANPTPLKEFLNDNTKVYYEMLYGDHHIFTIDDWKEIAKRFHAIGDVDKIILTTEKDAVRLVKFHQEVKDFPLYVMPIEMNMLFNGAPAFTDIIGKFIASFN
ncbi:MAG: tetraacyldisaccharide 4'-kinase [Chitinophagaceae bacterium]|nr:tetraacyldisaccharide 4'-kinase [Chitinophagaceae bacterium]